MTYRRGLLLGKKVEVVPSFGEAEEQVPELIEEYYQQNELPSEIACNVPGFAEEFLSVYPEAKVISPKEGRLLEQIDLSALNARQGLDAHFMLDVKDHIKRDFGDEKEKGDNQAERQIAKDQRGVQDQEFDAAAHQKRS